MNIASDVDEISIVKITWQNGMDLKVYIKCKFNFKYRIRGNALNIPEYYFIGFKVKSIERKQYKMRWKI